MCDESISFAIQKGVQMSRWYKHNDMADLERVLEEIRMDDIANNRRLPRRFIVSEGLSANVDDIGPLDELITLKKKYKCRLVLDESQSIGVLGTRGVGLTDLFNIPAVELDIIVGLMANALCSSGGFCAG